MTELYDCIYAQQTITGDFICGLGHNWPCKTDATICEDYKQKEELHDWYQ